MTFQGSKPSAMKKKELRLSNPQCKKKVQSSGLWLTTSGILGASPDGFVDNNAIVEVKCPFTQRDMTVDKAVA